MAKVVDPEYQRRKKLEGFFNLSMADYDAILAFQGGVCALCGNPPKAVRLSVDHDHGTGLVLGLLCNRCNRAVGQFKNDASRVQKVLNYLLEPPATAALGAPRYGLKGRSTNKVATIKRLNKRTKATEEVSR